MFLEMPKNLITNDDDENMLCIKRDFQLKFNILF